MPFKRATFRAYNILTIRNIEIGEKISEISFTYGTIIIISNVENINYSITESI